MAVTLWCWRCRKEVPMLDETEWQDVGPLLGSSVESIKRLRQQLLGLEQAQTNLFGHMALAKYRTITGYPETDASVLWHHRATLYGPPCENCGKPLRTPRANVCAACGRRVRR